MLAAIVCSVVLSPVAHAEWTKVTADKDGNTFYVDLERIKKHDGKVYFWQLYDYLKPYQGMLSFTAYTEVECGPLRYKDLTWTSYKGPMASGKISSTAWAPDKYWKYPNPNSINEVILNVVCNHKP